MTDCPFEPNAVSVHLVLVKPSTRDETRCAVVGATPPGFVTELIVTLSPYASNSITRDKLTVRLAPVRAPATLVIVIVQFLPMGGDGGTGGTFGGDGGGGGALIQIRAVLVNRASGMV